jgi:hypothetical protein
MTVSPKHLSILNNRGGEARKRQSAPASGILMSMELIFEVRDADEGGYYARALGHSIFTEAETWDELRGNVRGRFAPFRRRSASSAAGAVALREGRTDPGRSCMKLPLGVSADRLIRALERVGYQVIRQKGSHVRLRHEGPPVHMGHCTPTQPANNWHASWHSLRRRPNEVDRYRLHR